MPTHRDMPPGHAQVAARRRAEIDEAERRAYVARISRRSQEQAVIAAQLAAADRQRRQTSSAPPS